MNTIYFEAFAISGRFWGLLLRESLWPGWRKVPFSGWPGFTVTHQLRYNGLWETCLILENNPSTIKVWNYQFYFTSSQIYNILLIVVYYYSYCSIRKHNRCLKRKGTIIYFHPSLYIFLNPPEKKIKKQCTVITQQC